MSRYIVELAAVDSLSKAGNLVGVLAVLKQVINGKQIYIFEGHNVALSAWVNIKENHPSELILITLDHHTDVRKAFLYKACDRYPYCTATEDCSKIDSFIDERISRVDLRNEQSVNEAAADLSNNEQIDASMRLGIFAHVFCFNQEHKNTCSIEEKKYRAQSYWERCSLEPPKPPYSYIIPQNKIFEIGEACAVGCNENTHDKDCQRLFSGQAIDAVLLKNLICRANNMAISVGIKDITLSPFVLDIDLDYFSTIKSLSPNDSSIFHKLIRNAVGITIATEPLYVQEFKRDEELTSEYALRQVIDHIHRALSI